MIEGVTDMELYEYILTPYLPLMRVGQLEMDVNMVSPIPRPDGSVDWNPSFRLYGKILDNGEQIVYWKDWSLTAQYGYRPIHLYMYLEEIENTPKKFGGAAKQLRQEYDPSIVTAGNWEYKQKETSGIKVSRRMRDFELDWWASYGVTEKTLMRYNVHGLIALFHGPLVIAHSTPEYPTFAYIFHIEKKAWQVYRPKPKFFYTRNIRDHIQGWEQLPWSGDAVIIASGTKDGLVLAEIGWPWVAGSGERLEKNMEDKIPILKRRFKKVWSLMDNDSPGIAAAAQLQGKYDIDPLPIDWPFKLGTLDMVKDVAQTSKEYGIMYMKHLLDNAMQTVTNVR